jgi:diguanylate cyclase (GGDEF)-like protein/PAS domain S-box-containing protein
MASGVESPEQVLDDSIDYPSIVVDSVDLATVVGPDGRFRYVCSAWAQPFGWEPSTLIGVSEEDLVHPDDVPSLRTSRVDRPSGESVSMSYRFRGADGSYRWVEATSRVVIAQGLELTVSTVHDITERQLQIAALEHRATTDPLTGVANRTVLMDRINQGLRRLNRTSGLLAVLYLDLDRFKVINDSLGHRIGDMVLLKLAERLTHHLRPADTLARLGGDEFVIVTEGVADEAAAVRLANRIVEFGRQPFRVGDEDYECTVSVGIACTLDSRRSAEELLSEADMALYRAKDQGRDRAESFDEELRTNAVGRLAVERMLRRALDEERIVVEYQPIIDLRSGRPVSAEALVRVQDPEHGLLLPAAYLEVAEESGLLIAIDERVLRDAVHQAAAWRTRLAHTDFAGVAINVTARHLADAGFHQAVLDQLNKYGLPHDRLQIEVTERVLMEASNSAITGLRNLRDIGIQIGLDDFGTGYSSLAYLRQFPLDFVKIDKSFVDDLEREPTERAIVGAIIVLSHALGLIVVAEGVETRGQRQILVDLGCDRAQGYLFAHSGAPWAVDQLVLAAGEPVGRPSARK